MPSESVEASGKPALQMGADLIQEACKHASLSHVAFGAGCSDPAACSRKALATRPTSSIVTEAVRAVRDRG